MYARVCGEPEGRGRGRGSSTCGGGGGGGGGGSGGGGGGGGGGGEMGILSIGGVSGCVLFGGVWYVCGARKSAARDAGWRQEVWNTV